MQKCDHGVYAPNGPPAEYCSGCTQPGPLSKSSSSKEELVLCPDCGEVMRYVEDSDFQELYCPNLRHMERLQEENNADYR